MIELRNGTTGSPKAPVLIKCGDGDAVAGVSRCIDLAIEMGSTSLVVDLGDRPGACSALLGVLLRAGRRLRERGGRLAVASSDPGLRRLFDVTLLSQAFTVFETREDALVPGKR
ncbi:MAG TPA: STAS domain-containing protein [Gaiellaceae bacterium]|nr:STAS domain-containing protein [Gaiellaceae bacterium]